MILKQKIERKFHSLRIDWLTATKFDFEAPTCHHYDKNTISIIFLNTVNIFLSYFCCFLWLKFHRFWASWENFCCKYLIYVNWNFFWEYSIFSFSKSNKVRQMNNPYELILRVYIWYDIHRGLIYFHLIWSRPWYNLYKYDISLNMIPWFFFMSCWVYQLCHSFYWCTCCLTQMRCKFIGK